MAASASDVPEWPGFAGWFGTLLALLALAEPTGFRIPILLASAPLLGCLGYGLYRHLRTLEGGLVAGGFG